VRAPSTAAPDQPAPFAAIRARAKLRFALRVSLFLVLFLAPWPGCGRAFSALFCVFANGAASVVGVGAAAEQEFSLPDLARERGPEVDVWTVWLSRRGSGDAPPARAPLYTRMLAYTPLALFLALVLAMPLPHRRRLAMLGIGLGIVLARLALAIALPVGRVGEFIWQAWIAPPALTYGTPVLAWVVAIVATGGRRRTKAHARRVR